MNGRLVIHMLGKLLVLESALMLPALGVSLAYGQGDAPAFLYAMLIMLLAGLPAMLIKPRSRSMGGREGAVMVSLGWVMVSLFGALPFVFSGAIPVYIDALFETTSGFTTTGASILPAVEGLPRGLLLWRSFTHWVGGMGVLILTLAVLPALSGGSAALARAESPGPTFSKAAPRMRDTARMMYAIYAVLTLVQWVLLLLTGMPVFDAVIHTLGTAGTGGFSNRNLSVGAYNNPWAEGIITVFMLLFGMNFVVYVRLLHGEGVKAFKSDEVKVYWLLALGAMAFISLNLLPQYGSFSAAFRRASFQVSSIMSTTGFSTTDYQLWPQVTHVLLLLLMLVGACAGSTAGGLKVSRVMILFKAAGQEVHKGAAPRQVRLTRLDGKLLNGDTARSVLVYFFIYTAFLMLGTLAASGDGHDFVTSFSAAASCLSNIGPGLGLVGPTGNFSVFSPGVKALLTFLMLAGRLEFLPMLMLFLPATWRKIR